MWGHQFKKETITFSECLKDQNKFMCKPHAVTNLMTQSLLEAYMYPHKNSAYLTHILCAVNKIIRKLIIAFKGVK